MSCNNSFDAIKAAQQYCKCMKRDRSMSYSQATKVCDNELIITNRYYKILVVDMVDTSLRNRLTSITIDSVKEFNHVFLNERNKLCCREVLMCR